MQKRNCGNTLEIKNSREGGFFDSILIHDDNLEKDIHRDKILQDLGFIVLPIQNEELTDMNLVLSKIKRNFR
jgi:hypothetical protein